MRLSKIINFWFFLFLITIAVVAGFKIYRHYFLKISVPDIINKDVKTAQVILKEKHLKLEVKSAEYSRYPKDTVISQYPQAGQYIKKEGLVYAVLSKGLRPIPKIQSKKIIKAPDSTVFTVVPDLMGLKLDTAKGKLESADLKTGGEKFVETDIASSNTIVGQEPIAGLEVPSGTIVDLVIAK